MAASCDLANRPITAKTSSKLTKLNVAFMDRLQKRHSGAILYLPGFNRRVPHPHDRLTAGVELPCQRSDSIFLLKTGRHASRLIFVKAGPPGATILQSRSPPEWSR